MTHSYRATVLEERPQIEIATNLQRNDGRKEAFRRLAAQDTRQKTAHDLTKEQGSSASVLLRLEPRFEPVVWHFDIKVWILGSNDIGAFLFSTAHCLHKRACKRVYYSNDGGQREFSDCISRFYKSHCP